MEIHKKGSQETRSRMYIFPTADLKNMVRPSQSPNFPGMSPALQAPEMTRLSGYLRKYLIYSDSFKKIAYDLAQSQFLGGSYKKLQITLQILVF